MFDKKLLKGAPAALTQIINRLFSKGKGFRCRLIRLISRRIGLSRRDWDFLCHLVEAIHNSSLLHDDFIDGSPVRRGSPAAWVEFSPPLSTLAGDYLLADVSARLADLGNLPLIRLTAGAIQSLVKGEFLQREMSESGAFSGKKARAAAFLKTGSLFVWSLQAPFLYKKRRSRRLLQALFRIGSDMGALFQRSDDLIDFGLQKGEKEPFADLKQNCFNSFACFLIERKGRRFAARLKKVRNFKSFKALAPDYALHLEKFHQESQGLLLKTQKEIRRLPLWLPVEEKPLAEDLREAAAFCCPKPF